MYYFKFIAFVLFLIAAFVVAGFACGDDDDDNDDEDVDDDVADDDVADDDDTGVDDDVADDDDTGDDDTGVDDDAVDDDAVDDDAVDDDAVDDDAADDDTAEDFGAAVAFDGTDDYAYAADDATLFMSGDMTVEVWIRMAALPTTDYTVVDKQGSPLAGEKAAQGGYILEIDDLGHVRFCVNIDLSHYCAETTGSLTTGAWHHLMGVYDAGGNVVYVYFDGGNQASLGTANGDIDATAHELWIARSVPSSSIYSDIDVDEIQISNVARTTGPTYMIPVAPYPGDANTMALWHFDENTGTAVADDSGNGNDLTLAGGVSWITHE